MSARFVCAAMLALAGCGEERLIEPSGAEVDAGRDHQPASPADGPTGAVTFRLHNPGPRPLFLWRDDGWREEFFQISEVLAAGELRDVQLWFCADLCDAPRCLPMGSHLDCFGRIERASVPAGGRLDLTWQTDRPAFREQPGCANSCVYREPVPPGPYRVTVAFADLDIDRGGIVARGTVAAYFSIPVPASAPLEMVLSTP